MSAILVRVKVDATERDNDDVSLSAGLSRSHSVIPTKRKPKASQNGLRKSRREQESTFPAISKMTPQRSSLFAGLAFAALLVSFASGFQVSSPWHTSCRTHHCVLSAKRGRGSFQKESDKAGFSSQPSNSGGVRRDINWCPVPSGQKLPTETNKVGLLDTNLPTMKNAQTNPTGAVAVIKADNDQTYCFSSSCPSCKIPLLKATLAEPTDSTEPHPRLVCDFCKATYSLKDGERLTGDEAAQNGGLFSGIVKSIFSAKESGPLKLYKLGQKGKDLVIAVD